MDEQRKKELLKEIGKTGEQFMSLLDYELMPELKGEQFKLADDLLNTTDMKLRKFMDTCK